MNNNCLSQLSDSLNNNFSSRKFEISDERGEAEIPQEYTEYISRNFREAAAEILNLQQKGLLFSESNIQDEKRAILFNPIKNLFLPRTTELYRHKSLDRIPLEN